MNYATGQVNSMT